jgi:hypothetical protein
MSASASSQLAAPAAGTLRPGAAQRLQHVVVGALGVAPADLGAQRAMGGRMVGLRWMRITRPPCRRLRAHGAGVRAA